MFELKPLIINDETGEWVLLHRIIRVDKMQGGSRIFVDTGGSDMESNITSPLSPKELSAKIIKK